MKFSRVSRIRCLPNATTLILLQKAQLRATRETVCDLSGIPQYFRNNKMKKGPLAMALAVIFILCSLKLVGKEQNHCEWYQNRQCLQMLISGFSPPSQTVANIVEKKDQVKDSIYTLTIDYTSSLPTSLLVDTSALPSYFAFSTIPSSTSSSFALYTNLPMIAIIGPPVAVLLPQLN